MCWNTFFVWGVFCLLCVINVVVILFCGVGYRILLSGLCSSARVCISLCRCVCFCGFVCALIISDLRFVVRIFFSSQLCWFFMIFVAIS